MIQIKYTQNPGNDPSGKQARNKMKGGRKLGRKEGRNHCWSGY